MTISEFRAAIRNGEYVWPGGYPTFFIMGDNQALSFSAAKSQRREILEAIASGNVRSDWFPAAYVVNWENTELYCSHSGEKIPSAYGND